MRKVYLVFDTSESGVDGLIGVYSSEMFARFAVHDYLVDSNIYSSSEWAELADEAGYDSVEKFQEDLCRYSDYDEMLNIAVWSEDVIGA